MSSGPPPPPPVDGRGEVERPDPATSRRRRRRVALTVLAAVVVIGTPVGLAIAAAISAPAVAPSAEDGEVTGRADAGEVPDAGAPDAPDADAETDVEVRRPDLDALSGRDATWAQLLGDVDDSEQAMLGFQRRVAAIADEAGGAGDAEDGEGVEVAPLLERIRDAARTGARELAEVRPRLASSIGDGRVEEVRVAYLVHHDAWADYLDALVEDPRLLVEGDAAARWRLAIDASGETFARQLRAAVGSGVDASVRTYARDILRRGFDDPAGTVDT